MENFQIHFNTLFGTIKTQDWDSFLWFSWTFLNWLLQLTFSLLLSCLHQQPGMDDESAHTRAPLGKHQTSIGNVLRKTLNGSEQWTWHPSLPCHPAGRPGWRGQREVCAGPQTFDWKLLAAWEHRGWVLILTCWGGRCGTKKSHYLVQAEKVCSFNTWRFLYFIKCILFIK